MAMDDSTLDLPPLPGGLGGGDGGSPLVHTNPPNIPNNQKYMDQVFVRVDTNDAAANDTNLYKVCATIPHVTTSAPVVQISRYGTNALILKASHFDYSAETVRDFALIVCDTPITPVWRNINLLNTTNTQNGWMVQGLIPNWEVTDPMFLMVSNLNLAYNAFFQVIPYGGPQVTLTGPQQDSVVTNIVTLTATVSDLSGITNEQFALTVNGDTARYSIGSSNTINLDTRYSPNGIQEIELNAGNQCASVFDPQNPPADTKLSFDSQATLSLDFENNNYLVWSGDNCSPEVGTINILFAVGEAQPIAATITEPVSGRIVASYSGYVPYATTVAIPWNFTDSDGVSPYTNDTYAVQFTAYDPDGFGLTNNIDRTGVRTAGGAILTYEEEDSSTTTGGYLDSQAYQWISAISTLYMTLYYNDWPSITQYYPSQIGGGRDNSESDYFPWILTGGYQQPWATQVYSALTQTCFSDFNYYMGHANGIGLGGSGPGSHFVMGWIDTTDVYSQVIACKTPNWRMRKVALWACYTDAATPPRGKDLTAGGTYKDWPAAFGIRGTTQQMRSFMGKNVGLFFGGELPQGGYSGTYGGTSSEVAADFDQLWVTGPSSYSGGCDPTYSFAWAVRQIEGMCPLMLQGMPSWIGFGYLPYTGIFDSNLVTNNIDGINN